MLWIRRLGIGKLRFEVGESDGRHSSHIGKFHFDC